VAKKELTTLESLGAGLIAKKFSTLADEANEVSDGETSVRIVASNGHVSASVITRGLRAVLQDGALAVDLMAEEEKKE
jgi:hypothetical protein